MVVFHDLHPGTMDACIRLLQRMEKLGVRSASLLVVPNWYNRMPLDRHPDFCSCLRELPHDISLHGWAHVASRKPGTPFDWLVANRYTAGEGEFHKLPVPAAGKLVAQGLEIFRQVGIKANGFVAPAWLMEEAHIPILRKAGLGYCTTLTQLIDVRRNRRWRAPVLCCTSRTPLRRRLTRQVVSWLARKHASESILRIAVHPSDFLYPEIEEFNYRLVAEALKTRQPATYRDLVAEPVP